MYRRKERLEMVSDVFSPVLLFLVPKPLIMMNVAGDSCEVNGPLGTKLSAAGPPIHVL